MSLDAYRNSFPRIISVIIEIINYPFKLGKMRFKRPFFFSSTSIFSHRSARRVVSLEKRPKLRQWTRGEYDTRGWINFHISWTRMLWLFYYTEWNKENTYTKCMLNTAGKHILSPLERCLRYLKTTS
jgi:hypothetical protein